MIARAIERGVSSADIADALGLQSPSFAGSVCWKASARGSRDAERHALLDEGVRCPAADERRRQIEAADLMIGQHNFTLMFARAIRAATPHSQLVAAKKMTGAAASTPPGQQIARMERELAALQTQVKSVEETYGIDNLHLTVARGYVAKLLANTRITRWLSYHRQEYLGEFQKIAEIDPQPEALDA